MKITDVTVMGCNGFARGSERSCWREYTLMRALLDWGSRVRASRYDPAGVIAATDFVLREFKAEVVGGNASQPTPIRHTNPLPNELAGKVGTYANNGRKAVKIHGSTTTVSLEEAESERSFLKD